MGKHGGRASPSAAPSHIACLTNVSTLTSVCGRKIAVWELSVKVGDALVSDWAHHFRQSYCADGDIELLRLDLSREDYLTTMVFPHATQKPGPSIRSGDFAELLISDFLEYVQGFWVPRYKYSDKASPNESVSRCHEMGVRPSLGTVGDAYDNTIVESFFATLECELLNPRS